MRRIRRWFSSIPFYTQKAYQKMMTVKPSLLLIAVATIALSIFLLGGGVYDILEKPYAILPQTRGFIVFYPYDLGQQFLNESITLMLLYFIGVIGFLLMYQSTQYAYKPRQAFILLLIGGALVALTYLGCEISLRSKIYPA
ncbi:MAG: hypothetical protein QW231_00900 [Candidatus Bathyarchaeia archaeon]